MLKRSQFRIYTRYVAFTDYLYELLKEAKRELGNTADYTNIRGPHDFEDNTEYFEIVKKQKEQRAAKNKRLNEDQSN